MRIANTYRPHNTVNGYAAQQVVTIQDADKIFREQGLDWPVSGDNTKIGFGTIGTRQARGVLWA